MIELITKKRTNFCLIKYFNLDELLTELEIGYVEMFPHDDNTNKLFNELMNSKWNVCVCV